VLRKTKTALEAAATERATKNQELRAASFEERN
jgi:hypothetical protein